MLSAAHDIIARINKTDGVSVWPSSFFGLIDRVKLWFYVEFQDNEADEKVCNVMSTGAILLADIIPSLVIKALSPFLPNFIK